LYLRPSSADFITIIAESNFRYYDFHTLLPLPIGVFYKPGVKANERNSSRLAILK